MAKHHKNNLISIPIVVATLLTTALVFWGAYRVKSGVHEEIGRASEPVVSTTPVVNKESVTEIESPDSKAILIVKNTKTPTGSINQIFTIKDTKDGITKKIYQAESQEDSILSIPLNTFSPDNKYIFLQLGKMPLKFIVLRTDGKDLQKNIKSAEVVGLFDAKYSEFKVTDVTGWGGMNLLVVNADDKNGKQGASFWFDATNLTFIRLATRFN